MNVWPYRTAEWQRLRARILAERPVCETCAAAPSEHVDHVQAITDGGAPWDEANLAAKCGRCHNRKTRIEQGRRGELAPVRRTGPMVRGCDPATGLPLDPAHEWAKTPTGGSPHARAVTAPRRDGELVSA